MTDDERKKIEDATAARKEADDVLEALIQRRDNLNAEILEAEEKRKGANLSLRSLLFEITGVTPF